MDLSTTRLGEPGTEIASQYEEIADWFDAMRSRSLSEIGYLSLAVERAPKKGAMLDLGCGGGEPIARFFIEKGFKVTGVDTSPTMIGCCKERFPEQTWILGDMRDLKLDGRFDVIVAWDSFFHLNHESQRHMFRTFHDHCEPDGVLVFTSGPRMGETYGTMQGLEFYHASLAPETYRELLVTNGFTVVLNKIEDPTCGGRTVWVALRGLKRLVCNASDLKGRCQRVYALGCLTHLAGRKDQTHHARLRHLLDRVVRDRG